MTNSGNNIKVAAIQMNCNPVGVKDIVQANIAKADRLVREAADKGANIVLLPELFERQYFCQERRYDYYEYARSRQGTAKKVVPSSATSKKSKQVQTMTLKTNPTREATKKATRIAMGDDFIGTKKTRPATKKVSNTKKRELSKDEYLLSNRRKEKTF